MQGIDPRGYWFSAAISITEDGMLYYHQEERDPSEKQIYKYDLEGKEQPAVYSPKTGRFTRLAISPDGESVALEVHNAMSDEYSMGILDKRDVLRMLPREAGSQWAPKFSPDGQWIYYSALDAEGQWRGVYRRRASGSGSEELVDDGPLATNSFAFQR